MGEVKENENFFCVNEKIGFAWLGGEQGQCKEKVIIDIQDIFSAVDIYLVYVCTPLSTVVSKILLIIIPLCLYKAIAKRRLLRERSMPDSLNMGGKI